MTRQRNSWPPEELEKLKELLAQGLSARQAAKQIPYKTKNAVIGMANRMGLKFTRRPNAKNVVNIKIVEPVQESPPPVVVPPVIRITLRGPIKLHDASPDACRWIEGDAREMIVCGYETAEGTSWCGQHKERVFNKRA